MALIAVNTCVPTGDFGAWGEIGAAQLARLESLLGSPAVAERTRVLLLHHPPVLHRPPESRNLRDRAAFAEVLARAGADLVIHGHDHRDERASPRRARAAPPSRWSAPARPPTAAPATGAAATTSTRSRAGGSPPSPTPTTQASDRFAEVARVQLRA